MARDSAHDDRNKRQIMGPKQDIYTTPSKGQGTLQRDQKDFKEQQVC